MALRRAVEFIGRDRKLHVVVIILVSKGVPVMALVLLLAALQDKPIELVAATVDKAPALDGAADDEAWKAAAEVKVTLWKPHDPNDKKDVLVRVCRTADEIHFLLTWKDDTKDVRHQPFVWNKD